MLRPDLMLAGRTLAAECDAVLAGRFADYLIAHGREVPVWAWTNALAHGSEHRLHELAAVDWQRRMYAMRVWTRATTYLATELLGVAARCGLAQVQSEVLIPLELEWAASTDVERWRPWEWVGAVMTELRKFELSTGQPEFH